MEFFQIMFYRCSKLSSARAITVQPHPTRPISAIRGPVTQSIILHQPLPKQFRQDGYGYGEHVDGPFERRWPKYVKRDSRL